MKLNFRQIFEGWRNHLVPPENLKEQILEVSKQRLAICRGCEWHSSRHNNPLRPDEHCADCGCPLRAKTKCLSCGCDKGMWDAVLTEDEEEELNEQ